MVDVSEFRSRLPIISKKPVAAIHHFSVHYEFDNNTFEKELSQCGYYPLLTNKPSDQLSIEEAMSQYKCEHTFRRAKKSLTTFEPIYLHTPERIEALLFLFKIALKMVVPIERTARHKIDEQDRDLDGSMPNKGCP